MELKDKLAAIQGILTQNGISVNKNFNIDYLTQHDFYPEAREIANVAIDKIYGICIDGVNGGFNKDAKRAIDELSQKVVALTKMKNGDKKLAAVKTQIEKTAVTKNKKAVVGADARPTLNSYVTTTVGAIDAILNNGELFGDNAEAQRSNLTLLKDKLTALLETLNRASNTTSKQAADCARRITKELLYVRKQLSRLYCSLEVVSHADVALAIANEWTQLAAATDRKNCAKQEDLPTYVEDNISALANSEQALDNLRLFRARFVNEENRLKNSQSMQGWKSRSEEIDQELAKIFEDEQAVIREFQNTGNRVKAEAQAKSLKEKRQKLETEKNNLTAQINRHQTINGKKLKIFETLKREVYEPIMTEMNENPMQLCVTVSLMDFGSILSMLDSEFTDSDVTAAVRTLMTARVQAERRITALAEADRRLSEIMDIALEREEKLLQAEGLLDEVVADTNVQQESNALDELLGRHAEVVSNPADNADKNTTQTDEIVSGIHLTGDDK